MKAVAPDVILTSDYWLLDSVSCILNQIRNLDTSCARLLHCERARALRTHYTGGSN